jgi:hypothetical protein
LEAAIGPGKANNKVSEFFRNPVRVRARLHRLRKKAFGQAKTPKRVPQGLKPKLILLAFVPGINPRPTARLSFSAASSVVPKEGRKDGGLTPEGFCPDTAAVYETLSMDDLPVTQAQYATGAGPSI